MFYGTIKSMTGAGNAEKSKFIHDSSIFDNGYLIFRGFQTIKMQK